MNSLSRLPRARTKLPDAYNPWGAPVFPTAADNAMQPETFVPQGVQDWTRQAAPKDYNILSQIAGSLGKALMYPGQVAQSQTPISTEDMVGPAFNLAGMLTLGAGAAPQEANALNMGIKAYHGSPHDFEKFDLSKIGTGEGAQAYGHGLYFADNEGVAKSYRDALSPQAREAASSGVLEELAAQRRRLDGLQSDLKDAAENPNDYFLPEIHREIANTQYKIAGLEPQADRIAALPKGKMYEVNINADPSHFLDWDKPVSQQSEAVRTALAQKAWADQGATAADLLDVHVPGEQAYKRMVTGQGGTALPGLSRQPQALSASEQLQQAGIPGIKYLDEGSRNPWDVRQNQKGFYAAENLGPGYGGRRSDQYFPTHEAAQQWADQQQTRNYVVFNHDLIDIMRKYAVPGMLGAPILANALSEQKT